MAITPYRSAAKLRRDKAFSEFLTPAGVPLTLLAAAQNNLQFSGPLGAGRVDTTLTAAQIIAMNGAPVQLLAAPTASQSYMIEGPIFFRYTFATAAFTGGGAIVIQYHTGTLAATQTLAAAQLGASSTENIVQTVNATVSPTIGSALEITNATAAFAAGSGTLRVIFTYQLF